MSSRRGASGPAAGSRSQTRPGREAEDGQWACLTLWKVVDENSDSCEQTHIFQHETVVVTFHDFYHCRRRARVRHRACRSCCWLALQ